MSLSLGLNDMSRKTILAFEGEYRFLSNFYPCIIKHQSILFPSVEHTFQACKTSSMDKRVEISEIKLARDAKRAGRKLKLRKNWERVKDDIMYNLLKKKFETPELRQKLIDTGDAKLVHDNWWNDTYWGICNGRGRNCLGKLIMKVRDGLV